MPADLLSNLVAAIVFAALGIATLLGAFMVVDRLTPYALWQEIVEKQNVALAVLVGALSLGLSLIIAAAIL